MRLSLIDVKNNMRPRNGETVNPYQIPTVTDNSIQWANPDDMFTVELDLNKLELTGQYYDWDEDQDDWRDTDPMDNADLRKRLTSREFLLLK